MESSMHNAKIPLDSHIPENPPVPRRHDPLYSTNGLVVENEVLGRMHRATLATTCRSSSGGSFGGSSSSS